MRIAIVNTNYYPDEVSGTERSLRFLVEAAVARGHVCTVFTTGDKRHRTTINGVGVERFNVGTPTAASDGGNVVPFLWHLRDTYSSGVADEMADAIERFRPDVTHTNDLAGISVGLWSRLKSRGIPIVHTLRDYYLMCPNRGKVRRGKPCDRACSACKVMGLPRLRATKNVRTVIGNSRFILEKHLKAGAFTAAHREVIYNAYRPPRIVKPRRKVPTDRPLVVGYTGRLQESKGVEELIKAFRDTKSSSSREMMLHIAGIGDAQYVTHLKNLTSDLPVRFMGAVPPATFYDSVDMTVVPSLWDEPLARVILESFAHGVPVLASIMGGSPELVVTGRTGWLFDPEEGSALKTMLGQAVEESAETKYERLSIACVTDSQRFLPDKVLDSYVNALQGVGQI
jgi:glycosyltransferase involved in cell wall biosynthesis